MPRCLDHHPVINSSFFTQLLGQSSLHPFDSLILHTITTTFFGSASLSLYHSTNYNFQPFTMKSAVILAIIGAAAARKLNIP
jgi:hypothetical protein